MWACIDPIRRCMLAEFTWIICTVLSRQAAGDASIHSEHIEKLPRVCVHLLHRCAMLPSSYCTSYLESHTLHAKAVLAVAKGLQSHFSIWKQSQPHWYRSAPTSEVSLRFVCSQTSLKTQKTPESAPTGNPTKKKTCFLVKMLLSNETPFASNTMKSPTLAFCFHLPKETSRCGKNVLRDS